MHLFTQEEIDALPDTYSQVGYAKDQLKPGDIRYRDVNDDGVITEDDQVFVGAVNTPEVMYGFGAHWLIRNGTFHFCAKEQQELIEALTHGLSCLSSRNVTLKTLEIYL